MAEAVDLEHLSAELFRDEPSHPLDAAEWCMERVKAYEAQLAELVAKAPYERDPDRFQCLHLTHTLVEWKRAKMLQRFDLLIAAAKRHEPKPPKPLRPAHAPDETTRVTVRVLHRLDPKTPRPRTVSHVRRGSHVRARPRGRRARRAGTSRDGPDSGPSDPPALARLWRAIRRCLRGRP
jgi:hypothetical protein